MRQKDLGSFRTPQHPSAGTNNWGGASPLLARDIPKESLDQRYLRLNSIRSRDEIFPTDLDDDHFIYVTPQTPSKHAAWTPSPEHEASPPPSTPSRGSRGFLSRMMRRPPKEKPVELGSNTKGKPVELGSNTKKKRWFPKWDPQHRWPQGW